MVNIIHLSKTFINPDGSSLTVLKDVNCTIEKGEVISIIGPSGTGKSTLGRDHRQRREHHRSRLSAGQAAP